MFWRILFLLLISGVLQAQVPNILEIGRVYYHEKDSGGYVDYRFNTQNYCNQYNTYIVDFNNRDVPDKIEVLNGDTGKRIAWTEYLGANCNVAPTTDCKNGYTHFSGKGQILVNQALTVPVDHRFSLSNIEALGRLTFESDVEHIIFRFIANPEHFTIFYVYVHNPIPADTSEYEVIYREWEVCDPDSAEYAGLYYIRTNTPCDTLVLLDVVYNGLYFELNDYELNKGESILIRIPDVDYVKHDWKGNNGKEFFEIKSVVNDTFAILTLTNEYGCTYTDTSFIKVYDNQVYVPNIFTPNGDDVNEIFKPFFRDDRIVVDEFLIFNRWGALIYEEYNILSNEILGWSGRGEQEGVYVSKVTWKAAGRSCVKISTITLLNQ